MMYGMISPVGPWVTTLYVIPLIIITNWILFNFIIAILVDSFGVVSVDDKIEENNIYKLKYA